MKRLYLIGGTMGVGKTTACQMLKRKLPNCVFLDGDWCWDAHPFQVTDETKAMVEDNICHLLNNFIHCSAYENVVFCWVMHQQAIIDDILSRLDLNGVEVLTVSLVCDAESLRVRIERDVAAGLRAEGDAERSIVRLPLYDALNTVRIDTTGKSAEEVAEALLQLKGME